MTDETTLYAASPLSPPLQGTVVAVRGQAQEDQWQVIVQCNNPNHIVPLGYHFDYDDTTVTFN